MKRTKKESEKIIKIKVKKKIEPKPKKPAADKIEDVQRLVHLLQVHQIELEHQNEELRITQQELEVSRNKYVNLFDFSPIAYFTLDLNRIITEVNLSAGKMFGIERSKLIGKRLAVYIPLEERDIFNSFMNTVFSSSGKHSCELKIISKDKNVFHVLMEGLQLDDPLETDQKCQIALIDLTEYKRVEDSLKKSTEELRLLNITKDKFFSIIAHDLRSPFQALLSSSELLAIEIENLSQEEIILLSRGLFNSLKNLYSLLENLLHWSLMQRNMLDYKPVNLNLDDFVTKIIAMLNENAMKKNISISNNVDTGTIVYADVDMLRSVVQNLIINAIKFTQLDGKIIISSVEKDGYVEVSVQDNGIGIASDKISELFKYSKLTTTHGTAGEKGTGLGLPLCKEHIERNNGKIWVESDLGKGSKFIFTLQKIIL